MVIKRFLFLIMVSVFSVSHIYAQSDDFCNAVNTIIRDAPNKFRNVRGKTIDANINATLWACSIKVPGIIGDRFVASMGLFYEGAFFQSKTTEGLQEAYEKSKNILSACLTAHGYTLSVSDNFYPGLSNYKKLVFMLEDKDDSATLKPGWPPPHINMEVTYSKEASKYTIVMFIFEH